MSEIKVEKVPRQVIESKLLAALNDDQVAAVLFTLEDLNIVIRALSLLRNPQDSSLLTDLQTLREQAFPNDR